MSGAACGLLWNQEPVHPQGTGTTLHYAHYAHLKSEQWTLFAVKVLNSGWNERAVFNVTCIQNPLVSLSPSVASPLFVLFSPQWTRCVWNGLHLNTSRPSSPRNEGHEDRETDGRQDADQETHLVLKNVCYRGMLKDCTLLLFFNKNK